MLAEGKLARRHAGPAASARRRERDLRALKAGRIGLEQRAHFEGRRAGNRVCNQQRYKGGWLKPGITLRFGDELEAAFQAAVRAVPGGRLWDELSIPDHTIPSRGGRTFAGRQSPAAARSGGPMHRVLDSTGLQLVGQGE